MKWIEAVIILCVITVIEISVFISGVYLGAKCSLGYSLGKIDTENKVYGTIKEVKAIEAKEGAMRVKYGK